MKLIILLLSLTKSFNTDIILLFIMIYTDTVSILISFSILINPKLLHLSWSIVDLIHVFNLQTHGRYIFTVR